MFSPKRGFISSPQQRLEFWVIAHLQTSSSFILKVRNVPIKCERCGLRARASFQTGGSRPFETTHVVHPEVGIGRSEASGVYFRDVVERMLVGGGWGGGVRHWGVNNRASACSLCRRTVQLPRGLFPGSGPQAPLCPQRLGSQRRVSTLRGVPSSTSRRPADRGAPGVLSHRRSNTRSIQISPTSLTRPVFWFAHLRYRKGCVKN